MFKLSKPSLSRKKTALLVVAVVLLAGAVVYGVHEWRVHHVPAPVITTKEGKKLKLAPPTKDEKQQVEDHKSDLAKQEASANSASSDGTRASSVIITSPSSSNPSGTGVRAYVNGVFEEGGTCTATATQGSNTVTKSSIGFGNVSYTQCAPIDWDSPLGAGKWTISVSYKSASTSSSQSVTIEVK